MMVSAGCGRAGFERSQRAIQLLGVHGLGQMQVEAGIHGALLVFATAPSPRLPEPAEFMYFLPPKRALRDFVKR